MLRGRGGSPFAVYAPPFYSPMSRKGTASPAELESCLAALRRREAELKAELGESSSALRQPAVGAGKPCTPRTQDVALRIFALADLTVEAPLKYLSLQGRPASEADVRTWHAALPAEAQARLRDELPGDVLGGRRLAEARGFLSEFRLASWVQEQNLSKGVAPTSSLILERAGPDLVRGSCKKSKYRWVRKFMSRWGGRRARFGHGDQLSQEEFRQKACPALEASVGRSLARRTLCFGGPDERPVFRARKWGPLLQFSRAVPERGPGNGSRSGPRKSTISWPVSVQLWQTGFVAQAFGCWRWSGFLQACGDQRKPLLLLNMDETSVRLCPQVRKGWVIGDDPGERKRLLRRGPGLSLTERRSALTLVSFLADKAEFQHLLPQVFLSNEHVITKAEAEALNESTPENTLFIRKLSSWVNRETLVQILRLLATYLGRVVGTRRIVLSMDTYKAHLHVAVVRECARLGFLLHFVPASMTKWLQPLDVVVFKKYKDWIASETERKRALAPAGRLSKVEVFGLCAAGVRAVMEGEPWGAAFELAGVRGQAGISAELQQRIGWGGPVSIPADFPSAADLVAVFPRRSTVPVDELFELVVRTSAPVPPLLRLPKRARLTVKTRPSPPLPPPASPPPPEAQG
jgi:hypothetical protein